MPPSNPDMFPRRRPALRTLRTQLEVSQHHPHIGVTQGGSSRKWSGAKVAATNGLKAQTKKEE